MSLADFLVIAAEAVMGRTATLYNQGSYYAEGTFAKALRDNFKFGRTTSATCSWNIGLMPNPTDSCDGLNNIFIGHIYKDEVDAWALTAAISGAHTLGRAQASNSGFEGAWSDAENQGKFNNDYYKSILHKGWSPLLSVGGVEGKDQWQRVDQGVDPLFQELMLDTDMCLAYDGNIQYTNCLRNTTDRRRCAALLSNRPIKASDGQCCAWVKSQFLINKGGIDLGVQAEFCGVTSTNGAGDRRECCNSRSVDLTSDCDDVSSPNGPAIN